MNLIICLLVISLSHFVRADFFGGTVEWKFVQSHENITEIETLHRTFLSTGDACSVGEWRCSSGCSDTLVADDATIASCDVSSSVEGWKIAEYIGRFNFTINSINIIQRTSSCCWTEVDGTTPLFGLSYSVNLNPRSDTGIPNHSPQAVIDPLIRLRHGCIKYADIPVIDEEGDDVKCRFGQNEEECGSTDCGDHRYFALEDNCRLYYNAGGPANIKYGIRIIIEDYPKATLQIGNSTFSADSPISFVTIQFTVEVYSDGTTTCNHEPFFIDPTPPDGQTISIASGSTFSPTLYAAPSNSAWSIANFLVLGISNVAIAAVTSDESNVYQTTVQWSATGSRPGNHLMCFVAVDSQSHSSSQRCVTIVVGDTTDPCGASNGGCSDICVWDGSASYICECFRTCWHLAADQRNCIPQFETACGSDDILVSVPTCAVDGSIALSNFDTSSQASTPDECRYSSNDTHYWFQFSFQDCNTRAEEDLLELRYENSIRLWVNPEGEEGSGFVTRGTWYNVAIQCSYIKHGTVNGTFTPVEQEINVQSVPGLGTFTFFFNFFSDNSFTYAYSPLEYPISYVLNSDIFFGIEAIGGTNLQLFTESCTANPVSDASLSYDIIRNGCTEDDTLNKYDTETQLLENRFSIKAFRFRDGLPNITAQTNVFIQCTVRLCLAEDNSTRCYQGCITSNPARKKRNLDEASLHFLSSLSRGKRQTKEVRESDSHPVGGKSPIRIQVINIVDSNNTVIIDNDNTENDSSQRTLIIVAAGVGSLIVALLIATLIYTIYQAKQRKRMFSVVPFGKTMIPEEDGKWALPVPPPYFEGGNRKMV